MHCSVMRPMLQRCQKGDLFFSLSGYSIRGWPWRLTVLVEQEVHVCDGAMGHCRMAVAQTVHRLCNALQSFVQSKSLAEALLLALVPEN